MSRVRLEHVTKIFSGPAAGRTVAVSDLSLEVEDGEFLVLVGPSGCGKTTTLRAVAGLEEVTEGRIYIGDEEVTHLPPAERDVAMVFQNYALYPHKSVFGNMASGLYYSTDLPEEDIAQRVEQTARMLGIEELLEKDPGDLSGGQQQRVALGRAVIREPRLFLFDEPLSNLDARLRREMRSEIIELQRDLGVTTLYVTHDQEEAMTLADTLAVMEKGTLQQVGPSLEVYNRPANRFVAGFIGSPSMNFAEARLSRKEQTMTVTIQGADALQCQIPRARFVEPPGQDKNSCTLGVRPEDLRVADEEDSPDPGSLRLNARVNLVETLGNSNFIHLQFGRYEWVMVSERSFVPEPGETILCGLDWKDLHLFGPGGSSLLEG